MTVARVPGTVAQLEIQSIAAGGDGVGRADGLVVFVPRTAPGDRALVRIKQANRFARGELDALLQPSSLRVSPPCTHYRVDRCGGCQLQHIRYESQLEAKSAIVLDALQRIGKRAIEPPAVQPSERQWRYRRKLTLAMCRMTSGWRMGLRPYDDPSQLFQLEDCPITDERVVATWREIMRAEQSLPQDPELRGSVRLGAGGSTVIIEGGRDWRTSDRFFAAVPSAAVLWWKPERAARRLIAQRPGVDASATASFGQVNAEAAAALHAHVVERARSYAPAVAVDAYAGTGETAVSLAGSGVRVTAIELDRDAVARCAARLPNGSHAIAGRVEEVLARTLPADVVLLNPPRAGVDERVPAILTRQAPRPRAIFYVSCDPATLARDLTRLAAYRIASVVCFDMFPQTAHVETVCELVPEAP